MWEEAYLKQIFYGTFDWFFNEIVWFVLAEYALQHGCQNYFFLVPC